MSARRVEERYAKLTDALDRFGEVLARDASDDVVRDASIQRFEFTFELFWKALKADLEQRGRSAGPSPRDVIRAAYQGGWLDEEKPFLDMIDDRNVTSHTYKEELAREVFARLPGHYALLRRALTDRAAST